jgi:hypothetical protein
MGLSAVKVWSIVKGQGCRGVARTLSAILASVDNTM